MALTQIICSVLYAGGNLMIWSMSTRILQIYVQHMLLEVTDIHLQRPKVAYLFAKKYNIALAASCLGGIVRGGGGRWGVWGGLD